MQEIYDHDMLELGKGRITDMNMYHLLRKAENGLGSDIVLQEFTLVEIRNSVVEARRDHINLLGGSSQNENG